MTPLYLNEPYSGTMSVDLGKELSMQDMVTRELENQQSVSKQGERNNMTQSQQLKKVTRPSGVEIQRQDVDASSGSQLLQEKLRQKEIIEYQKMFDEFQDIYD